MGFAKVVLDRYLCPQVHGLGFSLFMLRSTISMEEPKAIPKTEKKCKGYLSLEIFFQNKNLPSNLEHRYLLFFSIFTLTRNFQSQLKRPI